MNIERLRKVGQRLLKDPQAFDMEIWIRPTNCGTVGCIAGHTLLACGAIEPNTSGMSWSPYFTPSAACREELHEETDRMTVRVAARRLLDLSPQQADRLFRADNWPVEFRVSWRHAQSPEARARVAVARIEHLIAIGE